MLILTLFLDGLAMISVAGVYRRNYMRRLLNGFIIILLISFWLMCHILTSNSLTKSAQREASEENSNVTDTIILSMVPQVKFIHTNIFTYNKYLNQLKRNIKNSIYSCIQ